MPTQVSQDESNWTSKACPDEPLFGNLLHMAGQLESVNQHGPSANTSKFAQAHMVGPHFTGQYSTVEGAWGSGAVQADPNSCVYEVLYDFNQLKRVNGMREHKKSYPPESFVHRVRTSAFVLLLYLWHVGSTFSKDQVGSRIFSAFSVLVKIFSAFVGYCLIISIIFLKDYNFNSFIYTIMGLIHEQLY